jgi:DNA-binding IclR family transcriptional regulator
MQKPRKSKPVGVLTKTFRIIETLQAAPAPLLLKEISEETGIHKSTALRFLTHLESERWVMRNARGGYSVGAKLLTLGVRSAFQVNLQEAAQAPMRELWRATQETVNLGILDGIEVVYLDCLESPQSFRLVATPGLRAVLYRTALGKAMLAHLPSSRAEEMVASLVFQAFTPRTVTSAEQLRAELDKVRARGYAVDDEESTIGVRCFAVPVLDGQGHAVAAISVSGPTARMTDARAPEVVAAIRAAAGHVSGRLR